VREGRKQKEEKEEEEDKKSNGSCFIKHFSPPSLAVCNHLLKESE
jgi:hypothetical protein